MKTLWGEIKSFFKVLQFLALVFMAGVLCGWMWNPPAWGQSAVDFCRGKVEQISSLVHRPEQLLPN